MERNLSEKWIKASIAGTMWAASEIVLGSFLHNLRVPFSGNVLTAIGIIILISISHKWSEKGLFWRAGLICALLKTMSPSAIIFGPMIAIFAESLLLELFTRLLGRTIVGYTLGAMAAMSWNLFQMITKYFILYGSNIAQVYASLLKFTQKQLNIQTDIVWLPIIFLLILFALFGLLAAVIGILVGRRMLRQPAPADGINRKEPANEIQRKQTGKFNYSIRWLLLDIILLAGAFILLNRTPWFVWSAAITAMISVWALRYKRALRQISKPGFWIFFIAITLLTAFAFSAAQQGENLLMKGLLTGIQMNFRAAVVVVGFSVIGTELYNPAVRDYFVRTSFRNLPLALELSAESLPAFIANIPDFKSLIRNPVSIFYQVLSQADSRLSEIKGRHAPAARVFIISGAVGEGKTTFLKKMAETFRNKGIRTAGILAERIMEGSVTTGYNLVDIETGEKKLFLRQDEKCNTEKIGKFCIFQDGLEFGNRVIDSITFPSCRVAMIDEIGMLEITGKGWAAGLNKLLMKGAGNIFIAVRDSNVEMVQAGWDLAGAIIIDIGKTSSGKAADLILKQIIC